MSLDQNLVIDLLNFDIPPDYPIFVSLASIENDQVTYQILNATDEVIEEFKRIVEIVLMKLNREFRKGNLQLVEFEAGIILDKHELTYLDARDYPDIIQRIQSITSETPNFNHTEEFVNNLRFYSIVIDEDFKIFRIFSAKRQLRHSSKWAVYWKGDIFDRIDEDAFILDSDVDCIYFRGFLFIFNPFYFEQIFDFYRLLEIKSVQTLNILRARIPIANFDLLERVAANDKNVQRKLGKIADKGYLLEVTIEDVKRCLEKFNNLELEIIEIDGEEKLVFDSRRNVKWSFLKLLEDGYLESVMTGKKYAADSKREQP